MSKKELSCGKKECFIGIGVFVCFLLFTVLVRFLDVKAIGPMNSEVGFATINGAVANALPYNHLFYSVSKYVGALALLWVPCFAGIGLFQLVKRKSFKKVDASLYLMAVLYAAVAFLYVVFEIVIVNYRPVDLGEGLEASYPSSHTLLAISICGSAIIGFLNIVKKNGLKLALSVIAMLEMLIVVVTRFLSGVHWISDIFAGILLGVSLILLYTGGVKLATKYQKK